MARIPSKEHLEELYGSLTNVKCCHKLGVTQVTFLRWLDYYGIPRKGSPHQNKELDHRQILNLWWLKDGIWARITAYNGNYMLGNEWIEYSAFYSMKSTKYPLPVKGYSDRKIYCVRCQQHLNELSFPVAFRDKNTGRCSQCESERARFNKEKAIIKIKEEESYEN